MASFRELLKATKEQIREVDTAEADELRKRPGAVALDVREPDEYEQGAIPGALHIPRGTLETNIESRVPNHDTPLVIYCAGGIRSAFAAKTPRGARLHRRRLGDRRLQQVEGRGPRLEGPGHPHARAAQPLPAPPAAARGRREGPAEAARRRRCCCSAPAASARRPPCTSPRPASARSASSTWTSSTSRTCSARSSTTSTASATARSTRPRRRSRCSTPTSTSSPTTCASAPTT